MYSTKTATTNNQEFTGSYMPVGINENVTLKEVNVNKTAQGRDFLEIIFENEAGQTATMSEWKNEKNMWIKTDEELQRRDDQQFGRILQILNCFYENGSLEFEGNSFVEMINWAKEKMSSMIGTGKLRLKVIYDKKGYVIVSKNGVFVEPQTAESQIKLWKTDLLERPIVADTELATDPLSGNTTPVTENIAGSGADDLPF